MGVNMTVNMKVYMQVNMAVNMTVNMAVSDPIPLFYHFASINWAPLIFIIT